MMSFFFNLSRLVLWPTSLLATLGYTLGCVGPRRLGEQCVGQVAQAPRVLLVFSLGALSVAGGRGAKSTLHPISAFTSSQGVVGFSVVTLSAHIFPTGIAT